MTQTSKSTQKIPRPASPDGPSDADVTLELTKGITARVLAANIPDRVTSDPIKTEELTANDILEVHNVVRAMRAEAPAADRTSEVDALDILEADEIVIAATPAVIEAKSPTLPPVALPPRRTNEPTKITRRDLMERVERVLKAKRARSILMLAAALGTWGFCASFAIVGTYGAYKVATHFTSRESHIALASPPSTLASDESAPVDPSASELAPLLGNDSPATSQLASISTSREDTDTQTSHVSTTSRDEIFRRPSKTQVGVLRLPPSVHGLLVDGTPERVSGGSLILACGDHRIRPPHSTARVVRVPCGKTVTL